MRFLRMGASGRPFFERQLMLMRLGLRADRENDLDEEAVSSA